MDRHYGIGGQSYDAKAAGSDHDRRGFLKEAIALTGGLAAVVAGTKYSPAHAQSAGHGVSYNAAVLNYLAHSFRAEVPRKDTFKWGWGIKIQQADDCGTRYIVSCENEAYEKKGKYTRVDRTRVLTTFLEINPDGTIKWVRHDSKSHLVRGPLDVNAITLHFEGKSINNLYARFNGTVQTFEQSEIGMNLDERLDQISKDQTLMHRIIRGRSGAHSTLTLGPTGLAANDKMNYEAVLYRAEADPRVVHKVGESSMREILVGNLNLDRDNTSPMARDDGRSLVDMGGANYSSIFAWEPDSKGLESVSFKIDTMREGSTGIWTPNFTRSDAPYWT